MRVHVPSKHLWGDGGMREHMLCPCPKLVFSPPADDTHLHSPKCKSTQWQEHTHAERPVSSTQASSRGPGRSECVRKNYFNKSLSMVLLYGRG